jgi:predicted nuclease of predicted toxin-antitoxin system
MKLLFDQNLSFRLCRLLSTEFPDSSQVRLLGMDQADDRVIWNYAKSNDYVIVSLDSDYAELAALFGPPPKVIWMRCGNQPTEKVADLLRDRLAEITAFGADPNVACLEIY